MVLPPAESTSGAIMSETATMTLKQNPLQYVTEQLKEMREKGVAPKLRVLEGEQKPVCIFDGREVINLASNNYLGLTTHKTLRKAALDAVKRYGVGAGAVRTIAGTMKIHIELEEQIAAFKNVEACVVFQSGFTANAGTVSAVLGKDDLIVSDELNHASIIDGARLSKATIKVFKHKDVQDCERILQEHANFPGKKLIITDGVFSMDGDIAPLPQLCDLAEKYNGIMMVDDAHASGVLGSNGRSMRVVHHHDAVVFFSEVAQLRQRRDVAVHGKNAVRDNQFFPRKIRVFLQDAFAVLHIFVLENFDRRFRKPRAVDDRCMIQFI